MIHRHIATGTALLSGVAGGVASAEAQEFPPHEIYLGAHGGWLGGDGHTYVTTVIPPDIDTSDASLAMAGALAGINFYHRPWLFGAEADVGFALDSTVESPCAGDHLCDFHYNAHLRGRFGYAFDHVELFGAVGWALAEVELNQTDTGLPVRRSRILDGLSLGMGADISFNERHKLRLEVLHDKYGHKEFVSGYGVSDWSDYTVRAAAIFSFPPH